MSSLYHRLKETLPVTKALAHYGVQTDALERGQKILCPLPTHEASTPGFSIVPDSAGQDWYCFGCKVGGDVIKLVAAMERLWDPSQKAWTDLRKDEHREILRRAARVAGVKLKEVADEEVVHSRESESRLQALRRVVQVVVEVSADFLLNGDPKQAPYLCGVWTRLMAREELHPGVPGYGFSEEVLKQCKIGFCPHLRPGEPPQEKCVRFSCTDVPEEERKVRVEFIPWLDWDALLDWKPIIEQRGISPEDAERSGLFYWRDNWGKTSRKLICRMGGRIIFPYLDSEGLPVFLAGRLVDKPEPIIPICGQRKHEIDRLKEPGAAGAEEIPEEILADYEQTAGDLRRLEVVAQKELAVLLPRCFAKFIKPSKPRGDEAGSSLCLSEPLMCTPCIRSADGTVLKPSPREHPGDVVMAEGAPDLISLHQVGLVAASLVTTRPSRGNKAQLRALAERCQVNGARLVLIFDEEDNGSGLAGALSTATPLHVEGLPVFIGRLPREEGRKKIDVNEFCRERGHRPGILDPVIQGAQSVDRLALSLLPADCPADELLGRLKKPVVEKAPCMLEMITLKSWDEYMAAALMEHFRGLSPDCEVIKAIVKDLEERDRRSACERQLDKLPAHVRKLLPELALQDRNDLGNARCFELLYGDEVRYSRQNGRFFKWTGHLWRELLDSTADRMMVEILEFRKLAAQHVPDDEQGGE